MNDVTLDSFELAGECGGIRVEVHGYENPRADNASDANWLRAYAALSVAGTELRTVVNLTTQDLDEFLEALGPVLLQAGAAWLNTDEDSIRIEVRSTMGGSATVRGILKQEPPAKLRIEFEFASDRFFVQRCVDQLTRINRRYPIIEV